MDYEADSAKSTSYNLARDTVQDSIPSADISSPVELQ